MPHWPVLKMTVVPCTNARDSAPVHPDRLTVLQFLKFPLTYSIIFNSYLEAVFFLGAAFFAVAFLGAAFFAVVFFAAVFFLGAAFFVAVFLTACEKKS